MKTCILFLHKVGDLLAGCKSCKHRNLCKDCDNRGDKTICDRCLDKAGDCDMDGVDPEVGCSDKQTWPFVTFISFTLCLALSVVGITTIIVANTSSVESFVIGLCIAMNWSYIRGYIE